MLYFILIPRLNYYWYMILPKNSNECNTIRFSMGQSCGLVYPILVDLDYIAQVSNMIVLNYIKFENIRHIHIGNLKLNISDTHPKGEIKQYLCIMVNHFIVVPLNTLKHTKTVKLHKFNLRCFVKDDCILNSNLQDHVDIIMKNLERIITLYDITKHSTATKDVIPPPPFITKYIQIK